MKAVDDIISGGVFGTIARTPPTSIEYRLREQLHRQQPVAVVFPETASRWPSNVIDADNVMMGTLAGDMFACNHRKKWTLTGSKPHSRSNEARREGLALSAKNHGAKLQIIRLDVDPLFVTGLPEMLLPRLLRAQPDAIFGVNTAATVGALLAGSSMGLEP